MRPYFAIYVISNATSKYHIYDIGDSASVRVRHKVRLRFKVTRTALLSTTVAARCGLRTTVNTLATLWLCLSIPMSTNDSCAANPYWLVLLALASVGIFTDEKTIVAAMKDM